MKPLPDIDEIINNSAANQSQKKFEQSSALNTNKKNKQATTQGNEKDTDQDTIQDTTQCTAQYTIQAPGKTELYEERLVANVTKRHKKYVKEMAKRFDNESAFVRYILDYFMNNINLK
jgi:hypothetical protein